MPIYEYRCAACGHEIEALQKLSDAPLTECPSCHKPELKKLLSAAGFQLKGSGWYATDFKNGGKPSAKPKDADGKKAADKTAKTATSAAASPAAATAAPAEQPAKPGSFIVQVADGNGGTDTITVNVTIAAVNDAPVITETDPTLVVMDEDGSPTAFGLTLHATDADPVGNQAPEFFFE